ncbi:MAG: hypothetical protein GF320_01565 [Armatimonadia bacterium]|nr:hypothetical protein [Armatimonadia bacterium]
MTLGLHLLGRRAYLPFAAGLVIALAVAGTAEPTEDEARRLAEDALGAPFSVAEQERLESPRGTVHLRLHGMLSDGSSARCAVDLINECVDFYVVTPPTRESDSEIGPVEEMSVEEALELAQAEAGRHMGEHARALQWQPGASSVDRLQCIGEEPSVGPVSGYEIRGATARARVEVDTVRGRVIKYSHELPSTTNPVSPSVSADEAQRIALEHMAPDPGTLARRPILEYVPNGDVVWHIVLEERAADQPASEGDPRRIYAVDAVSGDLIEGQSQKTVVVEQAKELRLASEPLKVARSDEPSDFPVLLIVFGCVVALGGGLAAILLRRRAGRRCRHGAGG